MHLLNKINILITVPCSSPIRAQLTARFDTRCQFTFIDSSKNIPESLLHSANVIIGEPDEADIIKATQLKWLQLTWAGAGKYTRMKHLPEPLTITNASGAFGTIISEYVIGAIIALYRSFPDYYRNQQQHLWMELDSSDTIYGKTVLILGTGDIGMRLAHRLKAFGTHIIGLRRNPKASAIPDFDEIHGLSQLDDMLKKADIVVGCLPNTSETSGLSGQHWYDSDRCTSGTMVWNASKSDQRNLHGNDSRYLFPVFCAGRNDHRYYEWSCISQTVRKEGKSAGGSCNDHCPGNSGKFCNQRSAVWRSYFFRIFNSGAASFTYTTWPDRKHFCSSVPDRLSRSLHRSFCSQCICDHAQWRNETETDRKCE